LYLPHLILPNRIRFEVKDLFRIKQALLKQTHIWQKIGKREVCQVVTNAINHCPTTSRLHTGALHVALFGVLMEIVLALRASLNTQEQLPPFVRYVKRGVGF